MFTKTLFGNTKKALALLGRSRLLDKAYLAGGTALALQLGHRVSVDLDFFTPKAFDATQLVRNFRKIAAFEEEQQTAGTLLGTLEGIRFSLFLYPYRVLFPLKRFLGIQMLDWREIAAMKLAAIGTRGIKRDFIDLYFILRARVSLKQALSWYQRKYDSSSSSMVHIQKSLVYFVDADPNEMPRMLKKTEWQTVKSYFEGEVKKAFG